MGNDIMETLAVVVPCYNEEEVLPETCKVLSGVLDELVRNKKISSDSYVLLVNDGSRDHTWETIKSAYMLYSNVCGLKLARNVGHQNALLAGLEYVKNRSDITISIDADLQDDVLVMEQMIDKYHEGCDIVYGVRNNRDSDSFFKRKSAVAFYRLMYKMGVKSVFNHADYRLMSRRAVEELSLYKEENLFLRGIIPLIGFQTGCVYYSRHERMAGESKYPLKKMVSFAWDGITSFSNRPITIIAFLGALITILSFIGIIYVLVEKLRGGSALSGWTSLMISVWFIGGVQLLSIGVIGEYVGKTYMESKHRPRYNIEVSLLHEGHCEEK